MGRLSRIALNERRPVAWFSPTYRMLQENWREMSEMLAPVISRSRETEHRLELITGSAIDFWSLENPEGTRGRRYCHVVINEAALVKDLRNVWNTIIRPTLADWIGSADFGSTPRGLNDFYELYLLSQKDPDWASFHYRTEDNPFIPRSEIESLRRSLPERVVRQELDAEFVEDGSYFQGVDECAILNEKDLPSNHINHRIGTGLDWGNEDNYTSLTTICKTCNKTIDWDKFNLIGYAAQRERIIGYMKKWPATPILPERNSIGTPNIELLAMAGLHIANGPDHEPGFNTQAATKPFLIQKMATGLEHEHVLIPEDYKQEFRVYELTMSPAGHPMFGAPRGFTDDEVISTSLAWWLVNDFVSTEGFDDLGFVEDYESRWA